MIGKLRKLWTAESGYDQEMARLRRNIALLADERDALKRNVASLTDSRDRKTKSLEASMQREFERDDQIDKLTDHCRNLRESWAQTITDMNKVIADRTAAEELLDEAAATIDDLHGRIDAMAEVTAALAQVMRRKSP